MLLFNIMYTASLCSEASTNINLAYPVVTFDLEVAEELETIDFDYEIFSDTARSAGLSEQQIESLNIRYCTSETMGAIKDKKGKVIAGDSLGRMGLYYDGTCYIAIDRVKVNAALSGIELDDTSFSRLVSDFTLHETGHYIEDVLDRRFKKQVRTIGSGILGAVLGERAKQRWLPHERFAYKFQDTHTSSGVVTASIAHSESED